MLIVANKIILEDGDSILLEDGTSLLNEEIVSETNYTLTAETGSFSMAGADVCLIASRMVITESGIFNLTGAESAVSNFYNFRLKGYQKWHYTPNLTALLKR